MNLRRRAALTLVGALLLMAGLVHAQTDLADGGLAAAATEESILLRWLLPDNTYPAGGFLLLREGGGSELSRQLPAPLPRAAAVDGGLVTDEEYDLLTELFAAGGAANADDELARAFMALATIPNPAYARATGTLYEDEGVEAGVTYRYTLTTAAGRRIGSVEVVAGAAAPLRAVEGLDARAEGGSVTLTWRKPPEDELVAAYDLYRHEGGSAVKLNESPFFLPIDESGAPPTFQDDTAAVGGDYEYTIEGIDLFGRRTPPSESVRVVVPDPRPILSPIIVDSEAGDLTITLTWTPVEDDRVSALSVRRHTDPEGVWERVSDPLLPPSATGFVDRNVIGGQDYYYSVVAVDASGRLSPGSDLWLERAVNPTPPSAPEGLSVEPAEDGLALAWRAPAESDVGSYRVYLSRQANAGPDDFRYIGVTAATNYFLPVDAGSLSELSVLVRAVNTSEVEGPPSNVASGRVIDTLPPPAPRLLDLTPGQGRITVAWAGVSDPDVAGLEVHRAVGEGQLELVAEHLLPGGAGWDDLGVTPGVTYRYALVAVDASGNRSVPSAELEAAALDLERPAQVSGVAAVSGEGFVTVTWERQPGHRHVVERARAGSTTFVEVSGVLEGATFTDPRGAAGDTYRVFAVNARGAVGVASAPVKAE